MDRREMLKGAGGAFAAASLGMSGLSESVQAKGVSVVDGRIVATGGPFQVGGKPTMTEAELLNCRDTRVWAREFVRLHGGDESLMQGWFANAMMVGFDEANRQRASAYDPVAVLEAMPDRFLICTERDPQAIAGEQWWASILDCSLDSSFENQDKFPDFTSAVRWLHEQAAAADAEFAKQWPVPTE